MNAKCDTSRHIISYSISIAAPFIFRPSPSIVSLDAHLHLVNLLHMATCTQPPVGEPLWHPLWDLASIMPDLARNSSLLLSLYVILSSPSQFFKLCTFSILVYKHSHQQGMSEVLRVHCQAGRLQHSAARVQRCLNRWHALLMMEDLQHSRLGQTAIFLLLCEVFHLHKWYAV